MQAHSGFFILEFGDDLLSQKLYNHYHRPGGVSRPCSEWERVVPPRYGHQKTVKERGFSENYTQKGDTMGASGKFSVKI
jgi:hypothetical protein